MAKLYNPEAKGQFVWAVSRLDDKARPPKTQYAPDPSADWGGTKLKHQHSPVDDSGWPIGRYDDEGFYATHLPPVPGGEGSRGISRYVRHPLADDRAKQDYERDLMYERHGRGHGGS